MASAYGGPGKYIQRAGEMSRLADHLLPLGRKVLVLIDSFLYDRLTGSLKRDLEAAGLSARVEKFAGECSQAEIERVIEVARREGSEILVGIGGGKTADTVKIAATTVNARIVIVPTIASTDAPCSAVAVRYTPEGVYEQAVQLPRNPDVVVVDTTIVANAPVRFLVAGMGDALSTWFEARSNMESRSNNYVGGGFPPTAAGIAIARACHAVLMRDGLKAKIAAELGLCTTAVENIIEANTLLSSIGFENCGCSAAHGIHDGLTVLQETHGMLHGEKVAFGTLCLLMLENRPLDEIEEMVRFCQQLGLPTTLGELGLEGNLRAFADRIAQASLAPGECTFATPVALTVSLMSDSILALNALATQLADRDHRDYRDRVGTHMTLTQS
jgi:glycerol dehydrogenase